VISIAPDGEPYATVRRGDKRQPATILAVDRDWDAPGGGTFSRVRERCVAVAVVLSVLALAGCGGQRQDADEPSGSFHVGVTGASFPAKQTIAQPTRLRIAVRNTDKRELPNVAVTVQTKAAHAGAAPLAFGEADSDTRLADTAKPVWILDRGPAGGDSAYTNTWALGRMFPGETKTFTWHLTAVKSGSYTVSYRVAPGLDGKARATGGSRVTGSFRVTISDKPVPARVDDNGNVVRGKKARAGSGL
jgi:hypothetical protein